MLTPGLCSIALVYLLFGNENPGGVVVLILFLKKRSPKIWTENVKSDF